MSPMPPACTVFSPASCLSGRSKIRKAALPPLRPEKTSFLLLRSYLHWKQCPGVSVPSGQEDDGSRDPERSRGVRSVAKMNSVRVLVAKGRGIARVSRAMGVSCAQRNVLPTGRTGAVTGVMTTQTREYSSAFLNIISDKPSYGYRREWGIRRKQSKTE